MNISKRIIFQILALILSWLVFFPIFLFLSIKWKTPKLLLRILLTIISPSTIVMVPIAIFSGGFYYYHFIERGSRAEIEARTGIEFPKFRTYRLRYFEGSPSFTGDFVMHRAVLIDTSYIDDIINNIENPTKDSLDPICFNYKWEIDENNVLFNYMDENDILKFSIERNTGLMEIEYGFY